MIKEKNINNSSWQQTNVKQEEQTRFSFSHDDSLEASRLVPFTPLNVDDWSLLTLMCTVLIKWLKENMRQFGTWLLCCGLVENVKRWGTVHTGCSTALSLIFLIIKPSEEKCAIVLTLPASTTVFKCRQLARVALPRLISLLFEFLHGTKVKRQEGAFHLRVSHFTDDFPTAESFYRGFRCVLRVIRRWFLFFQNGNPPLVSLQKL